MRQAWPIGVLAALLVAGVGRLACLNAEFWLDEIWSYELARAAGSPLNILFATRHDNNHPLNTLWLSLWPAGTWWGWYRLHAVLAGLASVVLAARLARRAAGFMPAGINPAESPASGGVLARRASPGGLEAVLAAWLVACCSWLVLAGAEARGYALAVCFALLALDALWSYLDTGRRGALALFWLAAALGFLSHLTFVHAYLGFVVWSLRRFARQGRTPGDEVRRLLVVHGVPGAFFAVYYLASIRGMVVGGGPPATTADVLARLIGVGMGGVPEGWACLPFVLAAILLLGGGLWLLWRQGNDVWAFFAVAVVGSPGLFLAGRALSGKPEFLFERYLFVPLVFFLLVSALALGALLRRGGVARGAGVVVLAVFLAGNARTVIRFLETGRGQFHEALAWVLEHDSQDRVQVTGDHDLRVSKYVRFYAPILAPQRAVVYLQGDELPPAGVEWLLVHRLDQDDRPPPGDQECDARGNAYRLVQAYPSRGVGAWGWFVYRRVHQGQVGDEQGRRHPDEAQVLDAGQHQGQGQGVDGQVRGQPRQAEAQRRPLQPGRDLHHRHQEQDQIERPAAVGRGQDADEQQRWQPLGPVPLPAVPPEGRGKPHKAGHKGKELPAE
jgi:hypothetical protein